jgi:hypothetical protein
MGNDEVREDLPSFCARLTATYLEAPSYSMIWLLVVSGKVPGVKVGSRWKVLLPAAEEALVRHYSLRRREPVAELVA